MTIMSRTHDSLLSHNCEAPDWLKIDSCHVVLISFISGWSAPSEHCGLKPGYTQRDCFMLSVKNNMNLYVWIVFLQNLKQRQSKGCEMLQQRWSGAQAPPWHFLHNLMSDTAAFRPLVTHYSFSAEGNFVSVGWLIQTFVPFRLFINDYILLGHSHPPKQPDISTHTHTETPNKVIAIIIQLFTQRPPFPSFSGQRDWYPSINHLSNCAWVFLGQLSQSWSLWDVTCTSITHISDTADVPPGSKQADQTAVGPVDSVETTTLVHRVNRMLWKRMFVFVLSVCALMVTASVMLLFLSSHGLPQEGTICLFMFLFTVST